MKRIAAILFFMSSIFSCKQAQETLFEEMPSSYTGINFENRSLEKDDFNIFNYRNFYNGGGVAIGDVNNDGLPDVFATSNFEANKLYLNKGDFKFEDISDKSGISETKFWSTGVTFADVNGDGLMDIYVCNSGSRDQRGNQLFINEGIDNGVPHFKEMAAAAGLLDGGYSTHAAFLDFDKDGDLDMYLLNNSFTPIDKLGYQNFREIRDSKGGDKFFRNDSPSSTEIVFSDVSEEVGIYGSLIGFGLGITIGDVNNDNWPDIYISNDFYERDYLYINQRNGTFKEDLENQMPHTSLSSMGADIADINNDGNLDIFVTDMLPGDDRRLKTTSVFEGHNLEAFKVKQGFWHQYMRNNLQLNNGDGTFSEIGQLAGVAATDWSWGALIFDMDNDGYKDLFVANGIAKDLTDQDFVEFMGDENTKNSVRESNDFKAKEFIDKISSKAIPNYAFMNQGNLEFKNRAKELGLEGPGFSNGSAYGDLDNDGDLDLIVNNVNAPLSVYKNRSNELLKNAFLKVNLVGGDKNRNGIGARVSVYQKGEIKVLQQMPNRGFQSSCDLQLVFGLGENSIIDSLVVLWPNDKTQTILNPKSNETILLEQKNANGTFYIENIEHKPNFEDITTSSLSYRHLESNFTDFDRDILLKQKLSTQGPAMAVGDVNGDGLDDVYLGGASGQPKKLFIQQLSGRFVEMPQPDFSFDNTTENTDALFFDADNDNDLDLYVVTGSNEFLENAPELHDLLYLNDGKGNMKRQLNFPQINENGSCVTAGDFDKDGDLDLFVGSRMIPTKYGLNPQSNLYVNDGKGNFKNYSKRYFEDIVNLGMVTDAEWSDVNNDGFIDLVISQDWGEVLVFINDKGQKLVPGPQIENSEGLWSCLKPVDIDKDGDMDFVVGNMGLNSRIVASKSNPAYLLVNDFDKNGVYEQIISCQTEDGATYPMVLKGELQRALPMIKQKYVKYADYANKTVEDFFSKEQMEGAVKKKIVSAESVMLINDGKGNFSIKALPKAAQFSNLNAIETGDFNNDGKVDLILLGNFYDNLPEFGRFDANYGLMLAGGGNGEFKVKSSAESGLRVSGQVRKVNKAKSIAGKEILIVAKNNDSVQVFKF
ncbi:Repeat domain-containing protein [Spirosomataceae bacterium TFI 002]|nr:Repeat domain-containing protein [Spirosomataceae bacterium TFI 002]